MANETLPKAYKTILKGGSAEIVVKKSRFIAHVAPAETEEAAMAFIEGIRKKYWDARHNCHAFCVGLSPEMSRCSDDGDPAQTAGKPMLDVLTGQGLKNTVCVVTRYFGGTLLGTGGLVRAYSAAVSEGLAASVIIEKKRCRQFLVATDYTLIGKLQYLAAQMELMIMDTDYTDAVEMTILVDEEKVPAFLKKVTEIGSGKVLPEEIAVCYGAKTDDGVMVFEI